MRKEPHQSFDRIVYRAEKIHVVEKKKIKTKLNMKPITFSRQHTKEGEKKPNGKK